MTTGRPIPNTGLPYSVGSPYSVKNFFQVNPLLSKANTRDAAMQEFTNFVAAADAAGINVMLDEPFNHSAWDCELDASGVYYFAPNGQPTDHHSQLMRRGFIRAPTNMTSAPPARPAWRWRRTVTISASGRDVPDIYFGRYAALVPNSSQSGNYLSEADWFDYSIGSENGTGTGNGHFDRDHAKCLALFLRLPPLLARQDRLSEQHAAEPDLPGH